MSEFLPADSAEIRNQLCSGLVERAKLLTERAEVDDPYYYIHKAYQREVHFFAPGIVDKAVPEESYEHEMVQSQLQRAHTLIRHHINRLHGYMLSPQAASIAAAYQWAEVHETDLDYTDDIHISTNRLHHGIAYEQATVYDFEENIGRSVDDFSRLTVITIDDTIVGTIYRPAESAYPFTVVERTPNIAELGIFTDMLDNA